MKKLFTVFAAIAVFNQTIVAQDATNNLNLKLGAKAGLNLASITGDLENIKTRTSFHLGGLAEININEDLMVQPELLFSSQGAKYDDFILRLGMLNLPVMAKYYVTEEFSLEAGPYIGFLLSAKLEDNSSSNTNNPTLTPNTETVSLKAKSASEIVSNTSVRRADDVKESIKSFDIGFGFGAGYRVDSNINVNLRYNLGLANGNDVNASAGDFKNSVIQLSASYFFD